MTKALDFDYDSAANCEIAEYRGLRIRAVQDSDASNPIEDSDGNAPMIVCNFGTGGRREFTAYESDAKHLESPLEYFTDSQLKAKQKAICQAIGLDWESMHSEAIDWEDKGDCLITIKRDLIQQEIDNQYQDSDWLNTLESLFDILGFPCLNTSSSGYSQGDYFEILLVATPEFIEKTGAPKITDSAYWAKDLESTARLYGAWAWGDCYGWIVESPVAWESESTDCRTGKITAIPSDWEELQSVWGYYGTDHDESGLAGSAIESANWILQDSSKRKSARLAELIKARVPFQYRAAELQQAAAYRSNY